MATITNTINGVERIINLFSVFRTRLIGFFSPDYIKIKYSQARKEQTRMNVDWSLSEFDKAVGVLTPDQMILDEIELLKMYLKTEIVIKTKSKSLDRFTAEAIHSNFNYLNLQLDTRYSSHNESLCKLSEEKKVKFDDVMVQNIELALFIKLASRFGLISYNHISDTLRAKCFSFLTNFSENSIRNTLTGKPEKNQNLTNIDQDNIDNLKSILNKIIGKLNTWDGNLSSL